MLNKIPIIGPLASSIYARLRRPDRFHSSEAYWDQRYRDGGDSGRGSSGHLAEFKAEVVNDFVRANNVRTVIEYGSGDGRQLTLADYPSFLGFEVSPKAIEQCKKRFAGDNSKSFRLMSEYDGDRADLTLSLDVVFHLVEDDVYEDYMARLFDSAERFVIIYSSNFDKSREKKVRRRKFSAWVEANRPDWSLLAHVPNRYPFNGDHTVSSRSEFFIYTR